MKKVILQYWEERERGFGPRPDGCTLHISLDEHKKYILDFYKDRDPNNVPDEYMSIIGDPIEVLVKGDVYNILKKENNMRLWQHELNNMLNFKELNPC